MPRAGNGPQSSAWPEFAARGDEAESPIPVTYVESWEHFAGILTDPFFNRTNVDLVYRGQKRNAWGLSPSLARLDENKVIDVRTAERQLILFRQAVRGRMSDMALVEERERDELWSVGQHHGLMTPVLDWTASPFVALFFAFEHEDRFEESPDRAVYVVNKTYLAEKTDATESTPVRIYEPRKDDYGRLVNQAGLFTIAEYGSTFENAFIKSLQEVVLEDVADDDQATVIREHIVKIVIPNVGREECLKSLYRMNVHHASLFPDIEGAAKYCNGRVTEWFLIQNPRPLDQATNAVEERPTEQPEERDYDPVLIEEPRVFYTVAEQQEGTPALPLEPEFFEPPGLAEVVRENLPSPEYGIEEMQQIIRAVAMAIRERQVVDWYDREPVLASMRNAVRRVLRHEGVGPTYAEKITEAAVAVAAQVAEMEAIAEGQRLIEQEHKSAE